MEATLKRATLVLLLTVAGAVMAGSHHTIKLAYANSSSAQTQEKVSSGSSLTFNCCLSTKNFRRYRVRWYFRPHGSNNTDLIYETMNGSTTQQPEQDSANECSDKTYTLSNINETHSGWYFCIVTTEIPSLQTKRSNVTEVIVLQNLVESKVEICPSEMETCPYIVTSTEASPTSSSLWMWIVLGVSSLVLFILIIALVLCAVKKRSLFVSKAADPIYMNSHHKRKQRPSQAELQVDTLKADRVPQHPRTPSPSGRYDGSKQRYHV